MAGKLILLHGVGSNRQDMLALGHLFLDAGIFRCWSRICAVTARSGGLATYGVADGRRYSQVGGLDPEDRQPGSGERSSYPQREFTDSGASLGGAVLLQSLRHETRYPRGGGGERTRIPTSHRSARQERIERMPHAGQFSSGLRCHLSIQGWTGLAGTMESICARRLRLTH